MSFRLLLRPAPWIVAVLGSLGVVTGISFVRAQNLGPPANVTFRPGGGVPVRGVPMAQRPQGISFNSQIGLVGPIPRAVQVNPFTPNVSRGFGQNPQVPNAPNFFGFGGQNPNAQGQQGGALGQGGGQQGGQGGQQGVGGGALQGGAVGAGGNTSMQALGQNFQNPTGTAGFPQAPVGYFGGFTGGGITGSGIAGNSGNLGVGISGGGSSGGAQGVQGVGGGAGGFGAAGFGGGVKGVAGAGNNGI